jgi:hypothetical protein
MKNKYHHYKMNRECVATCTYLVIDWRSYLCNIEGADNDLWMVFHIVLHPIISCFRSRENRCRSFMIFHLENLEGIQL